MLIIHFSKRILSELIPLLPTQLLHPGKTTRQRQLANFQRKKIDGSLETQTIGIPIGLLLPLGCLGTNILAISTSKK